MGAKKTAKSTTKKAAVQKTAKKPAVKKTAKKKTTAATTRAATKAKAPATRAAAKAKAPATRAAAKAKAPATTRAAQAPATTAAAPAARGPFTGLRDRRFGPAKTGLGMFSREGCFALAGSRALWGRPGANRVGWLSLDDGSFQELFACDTYANWVGTDGSVAIGTMKSQFVVLDPKKGKKPARYPGADEYCRQVVVTPTQVLTLQTHATKPQSLHVWNRESFKLEKVSGHGSGRFSSDGNDSEIAPSGHAAFFVHGDNSVAVWAPPYTKAVTVALPKMKAADPMGRDGARALGISSDGGRVAVLAYDAVYVVDVASGAVTRVAAPTPVGSVVKEVVRGHVYARSWVRPLPNDQVLVIDKTTWGHDYDEKTDDSHDRIEVVVSLYDVKTGARRAVCHAALRSDVDQSLGQTIAISDDKVLLNRSRVIELV